MSATYEKNLWSGQPLWFSSRSPRIPHSALNKNLKTDIVVVGAGISGATVAQDLAERGFSVIILERRAPGRGSTAASTALLQYDLDVPLIKLGKDIGTDDAARAWQRSRLGLENLAAKTQALGIHCDFERRDALYLSGNILNGDELQKESEARKAIGLYTQFIDGKKLKNDFGIQKSGALCSRNNLSVNPRKFAAGYLLAALEDGVKIYAPVRVEEVENERQGVRLYTDKGFEIKAKAVIFATGYEIYKKIKLKDKLIVSSWAFATKPQKSKFWPGEMHIWEASKPYLYIRTTPDGRVVCGGEDEKFSDEKARNALTPKKISRLQHKLKKLFPQLNTEAEFAWAGCFGETATGLPMMGPVPGMKNCFAIMAFGGNGITFSRIAADLVAAALTGQDDPDADLFAIK